MRLRFSIAQDRQLKANARIDMMPPRINPQILWVLALGTLALCCTAGALAGEPGLTPQQAEAERLSKQLLLKAQSLVDEYSYYYNKLPKSLEILFSDPITGHALSVEEFWALEELKNWRVSYVDYGNGPTLEHQPLLAIYPNQAPQSGFVLSTNGRISRIKVSALTNKLAAISRGGVTITTYRIVGEAKLQSVHDGTKNRPRGIGDEDEE